MKKVIIEHTLESCLNSSKRYNTIKEWVYNDHKSYNYAHAKGFLNTCTSHMIRLRSIPYTKQICIDNASIYSNYFEWRRKDKLTYDYALRNNMMDECTNHMDIKYKKNIKWTDYLCILKAKEYNSKVEWMHKNPASYNYALKKNLIEKCAEHMTIFNISRTKQYCVLNAKKYKTKNDWIKNDPNCYAHAYRKGWKDECCEHMVKQRYLK